MAGLRLELFFKTGHALRALLDFCQRNGVTRVNLPCKAGLRREALLDAIRVAGEYRSMRITPHFSVHYEFDRTAERTLIKLQKFVSVAAEAGNVDEILLVSGRQKRSSKT